ncbi:Crp/Fnr family transcriptional regulator [bacterium]|nr:Crp/Fnr family transcriptional regulator [bacterium]
MEHLEILKNVFIFSGFDLDELARIQALAVEESFAKGAAIFWEGDPPTHVVVVIKGKVKLFKQSRSGKDTILRIVDAGETLGDVAVFDGRPYSSSAKAMTAATILKIPRAEYLDMVKRRTDVTYEIILEFARQIREAQEVIQNLAVERVERRIVHLLLKLGDRAGRADGANRVRIPFALTRQDISEMVGSTVETTIRILSRMTKDGLIETKGRSIILNDINALRSLPDDAL